LEISLGEQNLTFNMKKKEVYFVTCKYMWYCNLYCMQYYTILIYVLLKMALTTH
jgi:hypothetical protein